MNSYQKPIDLGFPPATSLVSYLRGVDYVAISKQLYSVALTIAAWVVVLYQIGQRGFERVRPALVVGLRNLADKLDTPKATLEVEPVPLKPVAKPLSADPESVSTKAEGAPAPKVALKPKQTRKSAPRRSKATV